MVHTSLKEATRQGMQPHRAKVPCKKDTAIIADWERGTLAAGLMVALSFGSMLLWAAWWW